MNILRLIFTDDINLSTKFVIMRLKARNALASYSNNFKRESKFASEQSSVEESDVFNYKGFTFYYDKNGIRADLIRAGNWTYDEEICMAITRELARADKPLFLDIGAHAGFMTLNILEKIPSARVFAFEPGELQRSLFEKTIAANNLKNKVTLCKEALGREIGTTSFISQESPDADWSMSNGMLNTGRGKGRQKSINVQVQTIDNWWKNSGKPKIVAAKMDTEGAELWILQGSTEFLSVCRPIIFLEINPLNLHVYPYGPKDILVWLNEHNYDLETKEGIKIRQESLKKVLKSNDVFVARPRTD
jgi:FkbM family methyltransferase